MDRIIEYGCFMAGFSTILHFRESPMLFWVHVQISRMGTQSEVDFLGHKIRVSRNMGNIDCQTVYQNSLILYPVKLQVTLLYCICSLLAIVVSVQWYYFVDLVFISFIITETEHLFLTNQFKHISIFPFGNPPLRRAYLSFLSIFLLGRLL